jgi:hypothetical protein
VTFKRVTSLITLADSEIDADEEDEDEG